MARRSKDIVPGDKVGSYEIVREIENRFVPHRPVDSLVAKGRRCRDGRGPHRMLDRDRPQLGAAANSAHRPACLVDRS